VSYISPKITPHTPPGDPKQQGGTFHKNPKNRVLKIHIPPSPYTKLV